VHGSGKTKLPGKLPDASNAEPGNLRYSRGGSMIAGPRRPKEQHEDL
jgi:hypothetical protein